MAINFEDEADNESASELYILLTGNNICRRELALALIDVMDDWQKLSLTIFLKAMLDSEQRFNEEQLNQMVRYQLPAVELCLN